MNTWAWNYYNADSVSLRDEVKPAKDALEDALNVAPAHPLALHLTIHLFEPSRNPDFIKTAVAAGDVLRAVIPKNLSLVKEMLRRPLPSLNRISPLLRTQETVGVLKGKSWL